MLIAGICLFRNNAPHYIECVYEHISRSAHTAYSTTVQFNMQTKTNYTSFCERSTAKQFHYDYT
jgi:hypothetical protein